MDVTAWAISLMELLGGPGIALVIAAEALFPPIPGEILLPFAGVSAAANGQHVLVPIAWTTLGSVLGGLGVYAVGRALGLARTLALVRRLPLLEEKDVHVAMRFFDRWGFPAVAIARFVPMVRTFISIPAGIERMPVWLFAAATGLGSALWNALFVIAGFAFGEAGGTALEAFVRIYSSIVAGIGLVAAIWFLIRRVRSRRRRPTGEATEPEAGPEAETDEVPHAADVVADARPDPSPTDPDPSDPDPSPPDPGPSRPTLER
ncbi:DedA family protein [Brachybacterium sp. J144]|uniref:DedA family protein n=1 Tax=Brachybacterium sp. J144 TaxID=3116487 RepID=UPI002E7793D7|nr:DedA family protein [Brachybacterium sp. J144]MEE1650575.1 DedA family protein [Brachybacterium sp. J144]